MQTSDRQSYRGSEGAPIADVEVDLRRLAATNRTCARLIRQLHNQLNLIFDRFQIPDLPALARVLPRLHHYRGLGPSTATKLRWLLEYVVEQELVDGFVCGAIDHALEQREDGQLIPESWARTTPRQGLDGLELANALYSPRPFQDPRPSGWGWQLVKAELRRKRRRRRGPPRRRGAKPRKVLSGGTIARRLSQRFVADAPLLELAPVVDPAKLKRIEGHLGPQTLGSAAHLLEQLASRDAGLPRVGVKTVARLRHALEHASEFGLPHPATLAALVGAVDRQLATSRYAVLRTYIDREVSYSKLAREHRVSQSRIGLVIQHRTRRLRARFDPVLEDLLRPVGLRLMEPGVIVHRTQLDDLAPGVSARRWRFLLYLRRRSQVSVLCDDFLTTRSRSETLAMFKLLRRSLRELARSQIVTMSVAMQHLSSELGWELPELAARSLVQRGLGLEVAPDGELLFPPRPRNLPEHAVEILRHAGRPLTVTELMAQLEPRGFAIESDQQNARLRRSLTASNDFARLRVVRLAQHTYVHSATLGITDELTASLSPLCLDALAGATAPLHIDEILASLARMGARPRRLKPETLAGVLERIPEVLTPGHRYYILRRNYRPQWKPARQHISDLLRDASAPVSTKTIREDLEAAGYTLSAAAVGTLIADMPQVLAVGWGSFVHVGKLGLSDEKRRTLLDVAHAWLPADGCPVPTAQLMSRFGEHLPPAAVTALGSEVAEAALAGLLGTDDRFRIAAGSAVARRAAEQSRSLWDRAVLCLLAGGTSMRLQDVSEALERGGFAIDDHHLEQVLERLHERGQLSRRGQRYRVRKKTSQTTERGRRRSRKVT